MQKLDGKTFNVVQDNIEKLKQLFPEVFTENKIDFEKLLLTFGEHVEKEQERYEFTWNGKTKAIQLAQKQTTGTLRPRKEESVNWDTTKNLYIEGDNLEVLRVLQNSYRNKVKMIYIDPPYNTGKDFIYKDDFHDNIKNYKEKNKENMKSNPETNGRFHTDWLNMMYPRLKLARNLLTEDGVIFISIGDDELENLKKICIEIFGESNFIAQMNIVTGANQSGEGVLIQKNVEYCLVFSKNINKAKINRVDKTSESLRNLNDAPTPLSTRLEMGYTIYYHPETEDMIPLKDYDFSKVHTNDEKLVYKDDSTLLSKGYIPIRPGKRNNVLHRWRWGIETFLERKEEIVIVERNGKYVPCFKQSGYNAPKNIQNFSGGKVELKRLFADKAYFDYPKGVNFMKYLVNIGSDKDSIILDFFSGSATTAHAIMELNSEDGGNRKFIMVQLDEPLDENSEAYKDGYRTICDIGQERIRRAGQKILEENKDKEGIENLDIGFKVFKLDDTNLKVWDEDSADLERDLLDLINPIKEGRTQEDVVYEILLKYGIDLTVPIEKTKVADKVVYSVGMGYLLICLERDLTLEHIEEIAKQKPARVVFYDEGFKDDTVRINAQQILKRYGVEDIRVI
ncbi:site-specific DNA-methyltransferase [Ureibacillus thermosphaericus]|uniref:Adenine-specific DNA-methyltransferase n=1 Tax=Ureibacillus thermosphaericus TaxID=51173 RepID=A0A840PZB6_URETH|nr:site-specific DNA-methyltransferase [Ureibacillus thermosphaericus]MBB5149568.1 adenine-specific DNA-methyltransferase [Ureibacillus thermosphaericus]NKZ32385.1 site-specific DNA-methyltransferase [Ureibacillus thermosphaericus]